MNKKQKLILQTACLLSLVGCACFQGHNNVQEDYFYAPNAATENPTPNDVNIPQASNDFVDYSDVSANYKEFGERTPRDHMIAQNGIGSNVSASIPPTIEEEVADYEEEVSNKNDKSEEVAEDENLVEDPVEDWLAEEGRNLKDILTEWSDKSGWRLVWNSNRNYKLTAGAMFRGRFADVSSALIRAFGRAKPAPIATFYKGNRVLVVETREDENAY